MLKHKNILAAALFSYLTSANKTTEVVNTTSSTQNSSVTQGESSQDSMLYYSTVSSSAETPAVSDQYPWLCKSSTRHYWAVSPGPAVLLWHPPRICCGGTAHRTGPALPHSQGCDNSSWCLWFFGDTDGRWIPTTQEKQTRHLRRHFS